MNIEFVFDALICASIILLSCLSLFVQRIFAAIVMYICVGIVAAVAWARLGAWDVALAELAIGAGLTGALLLVSWHKLHRFDTQDEAE